MSRAAEEVDNKLTKVWTEQYGDGSYMLRTNYNRETRWRRQVIVQCGIEESAWACTVSYQRD